jgi:hypothetical protein
MRYAHVSTSCGCAMPGLARAAAQGIALAKAEAQGATPGRRKPQTTGVGKYVEAKAPAVTRKLRKVLRAAGKRIGADLAKQYAAKLQKDDGTAALIDRILESLDVDDLGLDLQGELLGPMEAAFRRAAAVGATQVGFSIEDITKQVDKAAVAYAEQRGGELIKDLAGTTREAMRSTLERAVAEGMGTDELADAIQALGAFSDSRAEMIARTELAFAHVQGNVEGWKASDEVIGKRWLLADTHPEPDVCDEAADAGVIGIDEEFAPGVRFPPESHPNCLCDLEPVLKPRDD